MKKLFAIMFALFTLGAIQNIHAKGIIIYNIGPKFEIQKELPADVIIEGKHVNVGVTYEQFGIFWLPVWNYGKNEYALVSDDKEYAWTLTSEDLEAIKKEYNIELAESPSPSLWNKIGLKPLIILILIGIIWSMFDDSKKKKEETI